MDDFPEFMKHPSNRIAASSQSTPGIEGYVFPKGLLHGGEAQAGTRTIHAFGGRRAERAT
jgi:hypothetical protein